MGRLGNVPYVTQFGHHDYLGLCLARKCCVQAQSVTGSTWAQSWPKLAQRRSAKGIF